MNCTKTHEGGKKVTSVQKFSLIFVFLEGGAAHEAFVIYLSSSFVVMRHPGEITLKINSDIIM